MAKDKKVDKLQADSQRTSRIEQTISTSGWGDIKNIIQAKYDSLMLELLEKENPEARGGINAIIGIMDDIDQSLEFGRVAREKFAKSQLGKDGTGL